MVGFSDDELVFRFVGDTSDLEGAFRQAGRWSRTAAQRIANEFKRAGREINATFRSIRGPAIAATASAAAFGVLSQRTLEATRSISDLSARAGVSAEFLQELRFVTTQSGASTRDFDDSISRLNRRLGLYAGALRTGVGEAGPAASAFEALGLDVRIASGELNDAESVFYASVEALQEVKSASEQSALASRLFGEDAGPRLVGLINRGEDGIRQLADEFRRAGGVIENEFVGSAADAADALDQMGLVLSAETARAISANADELVTIAQALADIAVNGINAAAAVADFFQNMGVNIGVRGFADPQSLPGIRNEVELLDDAINDLASNQYNTGTFTAFRSGRARSLLGDEVFEEIRGRHDRLGPEFFQDLRRELQLRRDRLALRARELEMDNRVRRSQAVGDGDATFPLVQDVTPFGPEPWFEEPGQGLADRIQEGNDLMAEFEEHTEAVAEKLKELGPIAESVAKTLESALVDAFVSGRLELENLGEALKRIFAQAIINEFIAAPIRGFVSGVGDFFTGGGAKSVPGISGLSSSASLARKVTQAGAPTPSAAGGAVINQYLTVNAPNAQAGAAEEIRAVFEQQLPIVRAQAAQDAVRAMVTISKNKRAF